MGAKEQPVLDEQGLNSVALEALQREFERSGEQVFRRRYGHGCLVLQHGPPSDDDWIDLNTSEASLSKPGDLGRSLAGMRAVLLTKSQRNAFGAKITVGRARNNDVILRAPKISKLHAAFLPESGDRLAVMDMGSLNGTVVNGERLAAKQPVALHGGDLISFWRYVFELVDRDSLIARLGGGPQPPPPPLG